MKTFFFTIALCFSANLINAQLQIPEQDYAEKKNSITINYNPRYGVGIKYDRQLLKKGKYSLVGQVGTIVNPLFFRGGTSGASLNFNAALSHRLTFGEHSVEAGIGVRTESILIPKRYGDVSGANEWATNPFLHLGYLYQPKNKSWFLRANLDLSRSPRFDLRKDLSVGFGIKF